MTNDQAREPQINAMQCIGSALLRTQLLQTLHTYSIRCTYVKANTSLELEIDIRLWGGSQREPNPAMAHGSAALYYQSSDTTEIGYFDRQDR